MSAGASLRNAAVLLPQSLHESSDTLATVTSAKPKGTPAMQARTTPLLVVPVLGFVLVTSTSQAPHEPERQLVAISTPALAATCTAGSLLCLHSWAHAQLVGRCIAHCTLAQGRPGQKWGKHLLFSVFLTLHACLVEQDGTER